MLADIISVVFVLLLYICAPVIDILLVIKSIIFLPKERRENGSKRTNPIVIGICSILDLPLELIVDIIDLCIILYYLVRHGTINFVQIANENGGKFKEIEKVHKVRDNCSFLKNCYPE